MKRILIVEDVTETRQLLGICLRRRFEVDAAADAAQGLERARAQTPDLILLDIGLPGPLDGLDLLAAIRREPQLRAVPVIILSGHGLKGETCGLPVAAFLTKPFSPADLLQALDQCLDTHAHAPTAPRPTGEPA